jgi:hypothetical protein
MDVRIGRETSTLPRFAFFEADSSGLLTLTNPRLRRCAPYLGLTVCNLFEVVLIDQFEAGRTSRGPFTTIASPLEAYQHPSL